jgi:glycosyl transferase family 25
MANAEDRRQAFADRALGSPVRFEFFDAYTALHPDLSYDEPAVVFHQGRTMTRGELGCYSSHYALWKLLLDSPDLDQLIVLEDDVIVDWKAVAAISQHDFAKDGNHYIRLFQKRMGRFIPRRRHYVMKHLRLIEALDLVYGTQGYVITKQAARTLVNASNTVVRPIDDQLDRFWEHGIPNLAFFPPVLIEEAGPSLIGTGRFDPNWKARRNLAAKVQDKLIKEMAIFQKRAKALFEKELKN